MFTFRAVTHQQCNDKTPGYTVHEADTYEVRPTDRGQEIILRRGTFPLFPDDTLHLYVGRTDPHAVVFVMNSAGRTVDKIE